MLAAHAFILKLLLHTLLTHFRPLIYLFSFPFSPCLSPNISAIFCILYLPFTRPFLLPVGVTVLLLEVDSILSALLTSYLE